MFLSFLELQIQLLPCTTTQQQPLWFYVRVRRTHRRNQPRRDIQLHLEARLQLRELGNHIQQSMLHDHFYLHPMGYQTVQDF